MKIRLYKDELYPVYFKGSANYGREYEIPEDMWNEYVESFSRFQKSLQEIKNLVDKQKTK